MRSVRLWIKRLLLLIAIGVFVAGYDFQPFYTYEDCSGVVQTVKTWKDKAWELLGRQAPAPKCVPHYVVDKREIYLFSFIVIIGLLGWSLLDERPKMISKPPKGAQGES